MPRGRPSGSDGRDEGLRGEAAAPKETPGGSDQVLLCVARGRGRGGGKHGKRRASTAFAGAVSGPAGESGTGLRSRGVGEERCGRPHVVDGVSFGASKVV